MSPVIGVIIAAVSVVVTIGVHWAAGRIMDRARSEDADKAETAERHELAKAVTRLTALLETVSRDMARQDAEIEKRGERHHALANIVQGQVLSIDRIDQKVERAKRDIDGMGSRIALVEQRAGHAYEQALAEIRAIVSGLKGGTA